MIHNRAAVACEAHLVGQGHLVVNVGRHRPLLYDLLLTLDEAPSVWRRVRMSSGATLARAQRVFCVLFGWPGGRPHSFALGALQHASLGASHAITDVRLRQLLAETGALLEFAYGAPAWNVSVRLESHHAADDSVTSPRCLGGEGASPPIDSGGYYAWEEERALREEHHASWDAGQVASGDLAEFVVRVNIDAINAELERLR